ncbi:MAG: ATPase, T2SS/T4P/T4SS family, partial [Planctomycetota bacterium]|nr:ATPase, T2SS/T4P/T4SS family [Planctomycetota bacterium]
SGPAEKIVVLPRTNVTTDGKKTILAIEGLPGTLAPESPGGPIWTSVSGVVVRVDGNTIVFNARLREGGTKEAVLVTDEETRILVDGEVGKVADLQPGMGLAIRRRRATPPLPGEVNVHATSEGLRGTFRKTEGRNVILTTTSPGGPPKETTVLTDGKTRVILLDWFLRPEPGTLRDIESGKLITVFPETGTATKIIVSVGARASTRPAPFTQPAATRIPALIGPLGSASAKEREEAQKALVEIGEPALEALKAATQPGSGVGVPFPEAQQESEDAAVSRLIDRAEGRNGVDGLRAREELVAMGHDGVPAILIGLKKAANSDPRILAPQQNQDFGWRLRAAMYALAAIGDRRALPAISTLTRYEVWKAARASEALSLVLAQGTPQQLQLDAKSESPGIAKAAQRLLDHPDELQTLRDKVVWMRRTTGGLPSSAKPGAIQTVPASPLPPGEPIAPPTSQPASSRIPALIGQLGTRPTEKNPAEQLDGQPPGGYYSTGGRRLPPGLRKGLNPPSCGSVHRTFFSAHASRPGARMKGRCFVTLSLPQRPSIEYLRKQAKSVLKRHNAGNAEVCLILRHLHRFTDATDEAVLSAELSLVEVQFALAMEYGFKDWNALKQHVESLEAVAAETASVSAPDAEPPWPELRRAIVAEAVAIGASDSHLEWHQGRLGVRQRVDGALRPSSIAISDDQQRAVIDGFKMMAALDTTVHDESQIGYCTCDVDGRRTSMRVSVIPYTSGESIAVRYLVNEPGLYNLGAQGWAAEDLTRLRQWISRPNGLIVVTGPAGSGRTTTIYGALHELASRGNLKIITAEDPVE